MDLCEHLKGSLAVFQNLWEAHPWPIHEKIRLLPPESLKN